MLGGGCSLGRPMQVKFCRFWASKSFPYCDGSHNDHNAGPACINVEGGTLDVASLSRGKAALTPAEVMRLHRLVRLSHAVCGARPLTRPRRGVRLAEMLFTRTITQ